MKSIINFIIIVFITSIVSAAVAKKLEFVIIVPSYNNEQWVERNLDSLIYQQTEQACYRIICIDDCSTDATGVLMDEYVKKHQLSEPFIKIIHNKKRRGALANIYSTIHEHCKDHEIALIVDGDDVLSMNHVLKRLEKEYHNPNLWLTYGQFIFYPSGKWGTTYEISRDVLINNTVRTVPAVALHLRTFRVSLFKKIKRRPYA